MEPKICRHCGETISGISMSNMAHADSFAYGPDGCVQRKKQEEKMKEERLKTPPPPTGSHVLVVVESDGGFYSYPTWYKCQCGAKHHADPFLRGAAMWCNGVGDI